MNPKEATTQTKREPRSPFGAAMVQKSAYEMSAMENRGGKSVAVLNVQVPLLGGGVVILATVWARVPKNGEYAGKLVIEGGLPRNCSFDTDFDRERFSSHVLDAAKSYPGWPALKAKAIGLLTGEYVKPSFDKPARLVETLGSGKRVTRAETMVEATGAATEPTSQPADAN
jgi:hypothetical protein